MSWEGSLTINQYPPLTKKFLSATHLFGNQIAIKTIWAGQEEARTITYRELGYLAKQMASALSLLNIKRGEAIAIIALPCPEWAAAAYGVLLAGGVVVPIDPKLTPTEVTRLLQLTDAKAAFVEDAWLDRLPSTAKLAWVASLERSMRADVLTFESLLAQKLPNGQPTCVEVEAEAFRMATSGTMSDPKVVPLTHSNLTSNITSALTILEVNQEDVVISIAPWHHIMGLFSLNAAFWRGFTLVYTNDYKNLQPILKAEQATIILAIPKLLQAMFERVMAQRGSRLAYWLLPRLVGWRVRQKTSPRLRFLVSGSAPMAADVKAGFDRIGLPVVEGYGLTETSPVITASPLGSKKFQTVGKAIPQVELRIDQPNPDGIGEVVTRGPSVMLGYYKNPERTAQVIDSVGWFHTGDLGRLDADGWLTLHGRKDNMFVLSTGKNIYPEEIEVELAKTPEIEDVMVCRGERQGASVVQVIVYPSERLRQSGLPASTIRKRVWQAVKHCRHLASYKKPVSQQDLFISDSPLEKTTGGKLKRQKIKPV